MHRNICTAGIVEAHKEIANLSTQLFALSCDFCMEWSMLWSTWLQSCLYGMGHVAGYMASVLFVWNGACCSLRGSSLVCMEWGMLQSTWLQSGLYGMGHVAVYVASVLFVWNGACCSLRGSSFVCMEWSMLQSMWLQSCLEWVIVLFHCFIP